MPFWRPGKNDGSDGSRSAEPDDNESSSGAAPPPPPRPTDEYSRLLPHRIDTDPHQYRLAPDHPAVSPYNLWSVRALRFLTVVFTLATFVWWTLQLVSAFATPPGLHTRGSPFFSFGYATLTVVNLLFALVFFGVPSKSVRVLSAVMAALLFVDVILTVSVEKMRYEEGWVGIISVVWALLMTIWTIATDRAVKWGKAEEEARLTGRPETRRTLSEWTSVLLSTLAIAVLGLATLLITLNLVLRSLDAAFAPPGDLHWVDGHKYRIHVYCRGNLTEDGSGRKLPTVLFEGGERPVEDGLWQVADTALARGSISRYCFADRPGLGWSDAAPSPLSVGMAADALSEALVRAGEHEGPFVLVSAGVGSLYSRVFSARHGRSVEALLLIDPLHEALLPRLGRPTRGFLLWLRGIFSPLGWDRLPAAIFSGRTSADRTWGRGSWGGGKFIAARLQESLVASSLSQRDVEAAREIQDKRAQLAVISSGEMVERDSEWEGRQEDLTGLTDNLKGWDVVRGAGHRVWESDEGSDRIQWWLKELVRGP